MINNFIKMKKIIVMIILVIMFIGIVNPVFAADNLADIISGAMLNPSAIGALLNFFSKILNAILAVFGPVEPVEPVEPILDIKISGPREVEVGSSITLKVENAKGTVTWKSTDTTKATVSNGVVKGVKAGEVTIKASAGGKTAEHKVNIMDKNDGTTEYKFAGGETVKVSKDVKNIIGNLTYDDYKWMIRVVYHEGGCGDITQARYIAATIINMVQYSYKGKSITYAIEKACVPFANNWSSYTYETTCKDSNVVTAVNEALQGKDPTNSIENYLGGKGAVNWYSVSSKALKKGEAKPMYDSNGKVKAYAVGTSYGRVQYFTGTSNLRVTGLHY
ncbi:MAG: hypothetical protein E7310_02880 [Clostridiales bacterium]|nr:hypothetical protein [Clostridiales bacterium]